MTKNIHIIFVELEQSTLGLTTVCPATLNEDDFDNIKSNVVINLNNMLTDENISDE